MQRRSALRAPPDALPQAAFMTQLAGTPTATQSLPELVSQHPYLTLAFPLTVGALLALRKQSLLLGAIGGAACFAGTIATVEIETSYAGSPSLKNASLPEFIEAKPLDAALGFFLGSGLTYALLLVFDDIIFFLVPRSWLKVLSLAGGAGGVAAFWWVVTRWAAGMNWGDDAPDTFSEWFDNLVLLSPVPGLVLQALTTGSVNWADWAKGVALNLPPVALGSILWHEIKEKIKHPFGL